VLEPATWVFESEILRQRSTAFNAIMYATGGMPRAAAWGLLLIVPGIGNFVKAWLTAREIARGPSGGER